MDIYYLNAIVSVLIGKGELCPKLKLSSLTIIVLGKKQQMTIVYDLLKRFLKNVWKQKHLAIYCQAKKKKKYKSCAFTKH